MPRWNHPTETHRFLSKVLVGDDCWEWIGSRVRPNSYGQFWARGRNALAHRYMYELLIGPIPEGLQLDHLCRNRGCVRPNHLEPVTMRENIIRGEGFAARNAAKTHCKNGHAFDAANTYIAPKGNRHCRVCKLAALRRWQARNPDWRARYPRYDKIGARDES